MANDWDNRKVLVIGAARQGLSLARYLAAHNARLTLNDQRTPAQLQDARQSLADLPITWVLGGHPLELLEGIDLVCLSGGVPLSLPLVAEALRRGLPLSNDTQVFMELVPCPVIGITGSAGKTTTTTLLGRMAQSWVKAPRTAWVGGNIGLPLISFVDQMRPDDLVILEISSFQLEQMTLSPQVAVVLNITPNHLDRHGTLEAYSATKARILTYQSPTDVAVLNRDDPGAWQLAGLVHGRLVTFGLNPPPPNQDGTFLDGDTLVLQTGGQVVRLLPRQAIRLRGAHNLVNVLAACAIASTSGLPLEAMQAGVADFNGVANRLQFIRTWQGAGWYNDSIATAPERTIAAINAFSEPLVLILGGRDKDLPWEDLALLIHRRVDHLIVFGEAAPKILAALGPEKPGQRPYTLVCVSHLRPAVEAAASVISPGDVVLFSPGGTSFDEFRDFEERGECFEKWVKELS